MHSAPWFSSRRSSTTKWQTDQHTVILFIRRFQTVCHHLNTLINNNWETKNRPRQWTQKITWAWKKHTCAGESSCPYAHRATMHAHNCITVCKSAIHTHSQTHEGASENKLTIYSICATLNHPRSYVVYFPYAYCMSVFTEGLIKAQISEVPQETWRWWKTSGWNTNIFLSSDRTVICVRLCSRRTFALHLIMFKYCSILKLIWSINVPHFHHMCLFDWLFFTWTMWASNSVN